MINIEDIKVGMKVVDNNNQEGYITAVCGDEVNFVMVGCTSQITIYLSKFLSDYTEVKEENNPQQENLASYDKVVSICKEIYKKKNHDYGDSFTKVVKLLGDRVALGQIAFKYERLMTLVKGEQAMVDESILDSIRDMVNYGIMWLMIKDENETISK